MLWLAFTGVLALLVGASANFGATYGPLAGTIAVLLWTFLSAVALLLGLAFAAQLEAVRAGVTATRVDARRELEPARAPGATACTARAWRAPARRESRPPGSSTTNAVVPGARWFCQLVAVPR